MADSLPEGVKAEQPASSESPSIWVELPVFVERGPDYFDVWIPAVPTGDVGTDRLLGEIYADIAIRYARAVHDPAFVSAVMAAIYFKTASGQIRMGETEQAFLNRVARLAYAGSLN